MNDLLTVTYKSPDRDGKLAVGSKTLFKFATPTNVYSRFAEAKKGDEIAVELEKNDKGFWNITEVDVEAPDTAKTGSKAASPAVGRSNYETPEERAERQKLIVRQSCLAQAVAAGRGESSVEEVLEVADRFVEWVHERAETTEAA